MGTIWVREFKGGLDRRRLPETSPGGTLIVGENCHITRGGDIEQRADFIKVYTLPAGLTHGLAATKTGLVVFGHQSTPPGIPSGVTYQRIQHPSGEALIDVPYTTRFKGKLQVIGEFSDGSRYMFYDGTIVSDIKAPPTLAGSGNPVALLTQNDKMYVAADANLFFSAVADSTDFGSGAGVGEGVIAMSTHAEGAEELTGLARYDEYAAIFSRRVIQTWYVDPDPTLNRQAQTLENIGTTAPRSVTQFGDGDVFFLDLSGIRSLRARDSSNSAATSDIGSPIDTLVVEQADLVGDAEVARAIGIIEPRDGRFWLALHDRIYVFSYFASNKVSAWTEYLPGFAVDDMLVFNDRVWIRSGDDIYVYGSQSGAFSYSDNVGRVWLPYLDADQPYRQKILSGMDAALRGTWDVAVGMDPNDQVIQDRVGTLDRTTFGIEQIPVHGQFNHISARFLVKRPASDTEPAVLSSVAIHFQGDQEEDS